MIIIGEDGVSDGTPGFREEARVLRKLANHCAEAMNIRLTGICLYDGRAFGCRDVHILEMSANGRTACVRIVQTLVRDCSDPDSRERLRQRIHTGLDRLWRPRGRPSGNSRCSPPRFPGFRGRGSALP
ncbi:hypothetical protein [Geobacter sp. SVR]|uniref:hypothetical protein n=1 Tax=Geobacter sp. SVR TaxID=2495594 RepID=UPI00143EFE22|nr:hypothetical protein [Geobacter sp. SVR]BCS53524.1 hypothetical protein GSVR_18320 [Geobacter sp. SVR]GCF84279.1 hypothetical protein GSbR_08790 [Geobacter sp. SVR]